MLEYELEEAIKLAFPDHKEYYEHIDINCPECSSQNYGESDGKYNLSISLTKGIYKCWKCETKGGVHKLFRLYSPNVKLSDTFILNKGLEKKFQKVRLPKDTIEFKDLDLSNEFHKSCYDYLVEKRKIEPSILTKYGVKVIADGYYGGRVLIPSYNRNNHLNYFTTRAIGNNNLKYLNPKVDKEKILFNENRINWNIELFLVEGVFDMFALPFNTAVMLGKSISDYLAEQIIKHRTPICLGLDDDAIQKSMELLSTFQNIGIKVSMLPIYSGDLSEINQNEGKKGILNLIKNKISI